MSLQAWYPFNGNYENLGIGDADLAVVTTPTYSTGKVTEKCLNAGALKIKAEYASKILNNKALSICFWLKPSQSSGTSEIFYQHSSVRQFCIYTYPTLNDLHLDWRYNDAGSYMTAYVSNGFFPTNTWTHCAITFEYPNIIKIYKNGILHATETGKGTMNLSSFYYDATIKNITTRHLNDFRIYDHCLSPKEVKEISKGLVLHYPLDNCGMGCKNYIKNSLNIKPAPCNYNYGTYSTTAVELSDDKFKGTFYRVLRGGTGGGDFRIGWTDQKISIKPDEYNDKKVTFSAWVKSSTGTTFTCSLGRFSDLDINGIGSFVIEAEKWTKISGSKTFLSSSANATADALELYFNLSFNTDIIIAQAKLEIADEATPWCPNEADELYSQLGMDDNIEYDTSGYGNNGTKIGTLNYESGTPRHQSSSYFNGTDACVKAPKLTLDMTNITFSTWYKPSGAINFGRIFDFSAGSDGNATTFLIAHYGTNMQLCVHGRYPNGNSIFLTTDTLYPIVAGTWYHVACTISGTTCKWYIDGKLVMTKTLTQSLGVVNFINNYLAESTWTIDPLNKCNISDFRIYATCLSDSDIQELYNKPISIDNQGTMFAVEAAEETASPVKFNKTGVVEANQIGEYFHNYFTYDGPMYTGINNKVKIEKLIENNGLKLTCNSAVTTHTILHRMQSLMFNGASGDFKMEFDGWATNPVDIRFDICDKTVATYSFNSTKQHFSGVAYGVNQYNTNSAYNGFFDIEASSIPLGTEIYITNIVITKNTPKSVGSNYIVIDDIIEN